MSPRGQSRDVAAQSGSHRRRQDDSGTLCGLRETLARMFDGVCEGLPPPTTRAGHKETFGALAGLVIMTAGSSVN